MVAICPSNSNTVAANVQLRSKNKRFTIVLPKEARDLGLAPSAGSTAVIFAAGGLLEIWRASSWLEHIHKAHAELPTIIEAAADEIERRGS